MQLDSTRNYIMIVNLGLAMLNVSAMVATIIPCFWGMNLPHGLPETPVMFYALCGTSLALAWLTFPLAKDWYVRHWSRQTQSQLLEPKTLRCVICVAYFSPIFLLPHTECAFAVREG